MPAVYTPPAYRLQTALQRPARRAAFVVPLPTVPGGFRVVAADPPYRFRSNCVAEPGRNAMRHYACMSLDAITALPVADIVAPDAVLLLWVPGPFLVVGAQISIMRAWGFTPTAFGFVWIKTNADGSIFSGTGFTTSQERRIRGARQTWTLGSARGRCPRGHPRPRPKAR